MKYAATFEVELLDQEIDKFKQLASELGKSFPETFIMCAVERRDELLEMFKKNLPSSEGEDVPETPDGNSIQRTGEGT